jgi:hypothetical protein
MLGALGIARKVESFRKRLSSSTLRNTILYSPRRKNTGWPSRSVVDELVYAWCKHPIRPTRSSSGDVDVDVCLLVRLSQVHHVRHDDDVQIQRRKTSLQDAAFLNSNSSTLFEMFKKKEDAKKVKPLP